MALITVTSAQWQAIHNLITGAICYTLDGSGNVNMIVMRNQPADVFAISPAVTTEAQLLTFLGEYKSVKASAITP